MEPSKTLTLQDLINLSRPFTTSTTPKSPNPKTPIQKTPNPKTPNFRTLTPLHNPSFLAGTLNLPTDTSSKDPLCLRFSDGSATVSCDVLGLDLRLIGARIQATAYNFIPFRRGRGGFLEIIKWVSPDFDVMVNVDSNVGSIRLGLGSDSKAKYSVHGALECVSPVSVVPCSGGSGCTSLCGFLMQVMVCEVCGCEGVGLGCGDEGHLYGNPVFVYFCGFASSWHPVMTKLVGKVVGLSGLRKKSVVFTGEGEGESRLMFVTSESTALCLHRPPKRWRLCGHSVVKGRGECGVYAGVVKGVYMQGMVVELDKDVWILLTDQLLAPPHSFRIGALVTVRNVHFVNPKFHWAKFLVLGACSKTSITVESFSPLETGCHLVSPSESLLGSFIGSLTFSARLWVLLLVSCFRKKFIGTLSEKEIFGSKHKEGLVQMYASSHLPPSVFRSRHGVLSELCKHDSYGCGIEPYYGDFKFVASISTFVNHCEMRWITHLQPEDNRQLSYDNTKSTPSRDAKSCCHRKIFPSENTSPVLLGRLKVSPSSGGLQLVDGTGCIDVIIPDLPSTWDSNSIYEVTDYTIIIEGMPQLMDHSRVPDKESFSPRAVFRSAPLAREMKLKIFIYFSMRSSTCRIYPKIVGMDNSSEVERGTFHLLYITHKFPLPQKGDLVKSKKSSMFAEAIVLPWDLVLAGKDGLLYSNEETRYQLKEPLGHIACRNSEEKVSSKRRKTNLSSGWAFAANQMDDSGSACSEMRRCSGLNTEPNVERGCHDSSSSHDIPCSATIRRGNNQSETISGLLCCVKANTKFVGAKPSPRKVLLELDSDSFARYQLLQIGGYYITKHDRDDSICKLKDLDYARGVKVLTTASTFMRSISFSCNEYLLDDSSINIKEVPSGDQMELHLQSYKGHSAGTYSDVCLCLSSDIIGVWEANLKECVGNPLKSAVPQQKISNGFPASGTTSRLFPGYPHSNGLFPEGNLISLSGDVVYLDYSLANSDKLRSHRTVGSDICIHVMADHDTVKISGSLNKYAFPTGFGPGVNATFHRLLELGVKNRMMMTPVSFIVINSIRGVSDPHDDIRNDSAQVASDKLDVASRDLSSALISEFAQLTECNPVRFNCRVVSIHILIMKKYERHRGTNIHSTPLPIDIPVACFVLEDGSSSCYCWASAERAATFLRLHEKLPERAFESSSSSSRRSKRFGKDRSTNRTAIHHLERILKKHDRVTLKSHALSLDSSCQDLTASAGTQNTLSSTDETLLKIMAGMACSATCLSVVGSVMELDDVGRLEMQHHIEMESRVQSMKHVWATQVYTTNPLTEARNIIRLLQNR